MRAIVTSRLIPILTITASLPLFASYVIKNVLVTGPIFVLLYTAGLVSVLLVPALMTIEVILCALAKTWDLSLAWHVASLSIASVAEGIFLVVRRL